MKSVFLKNWSQSLPVGALQFSAPGGSQLRPGGDGPVTWVQTPEVALLQGLTETRYNEAENRRTPCGKCIPHNYDSPIQSFRMLGRFKHLTGSCKKGALLDSSSISYHFICVNF